MRRTLQIVAFVGTLLVGIIALALIVSQTPWFRDWLRKYVVRQAGTYVNGTVSIGSLGGNLFYGVQLGDVKVDVNGEHVLTLKSVEIKYSLSELVAQGVTVREIRLEEPYILARRDASGWNLARLARKQAQEADRKGPRKPLSLPSIEIVNGRVVVDDRAPSRTYRWPSRIEALNVKAGFEYAPVHYSVTLDHLSFAGKAPDLTVQKLAGRIGTRDDNLNFEKLFLQTAESSVTIDGVVRNYLAKPSLQITASSPRLSLPEFGGVLPVVQGYNLHPTFDVKAEGLQEALKLALNVKSEAGIVTGNVVADLRTPDLGASGDVNVQNLDLAPILKSPPRKSDITGQAKLDLKVTSAPASAPIVERLRGRVVFQGPKVVAEGYSASDVRLTADLAGRRVGIDGRARAYGGSATAKGFIATPATAGQPVQFDLAGSASAINLAGLPPKLRAPRIPTHLNATAYHVKGSVGRTTTIEGTATMAESTIADGTILGGTSAEFAMTSGPGKAGLQSLTYAARGEVKDLNLRKVGEAFQIAALAKPEYDSRINTTFDVQGSGTTADRIRVDATGTATNSEVFGGTLPRMAYEAHLADNAISGRATGAFQGFDPSRIAANPRFKGTVTGTVDASFAVANLNAPITPDSVTADGRVTLAKSDVGGLQIDTADVQGQYANRRGTLRQATVKGPDIEVTASGPIALDQTGRTNLTYHVAATNLENLGKLANQPGLAGSAVLDGTITGNAASLTIAGAVDGSNVAYEKNKALDLNSTYTVTVPNLEFARARVEADTNATFVEVGGMQLQTVTAKTTYVDKTLQFEAKLAEAPASAQGSGAAGLSGGQRELDASGSVVFHPDHQEFHLPSLALRTQGIEWKTAPGAEATVKYGARQIELVNVRLVNADQVLNVDGSFSLGDNPEIGAIKVHAENVDIAQVEKLTLQNRGFTGKLNADATIAGSAKSPSVTGHLEVSDGTFQQFKYQSLVADGTYANERIGIDARLVQSPGVELTAKGSVPLSALRSTAEPAGSHVQTAAADSIDLRIQSPRIELGLIQGFTNLVTNVTGTLQADIHVTGTGRDPHLKGYVDIQNGAFGLVPAGVSFSGLSTRLDLDADRIRVPRFQILDENKHPLTIEGELAVHERQPGAVNISITSDNFQILDNELGEFNVETRLRLTGEVRKPRIEGELRTDVARVEVDRVLLMFSNPYSEEALPEVVSAQETTKSIKGADEATRDALEKGRQLSAEAAPRQNATAPVAAAPQTGIFSALELNVHVVAPDNFVVRGEDIRPGGATAAQVGSVNTTVGVDVQVTKRENGPITIRGTANTVRGFYEFQGRRFTVERGGTLQFHGLPQINPDLNVAAERLIPNTGVTARIQITGTARAPQIALSSNPPLDEADILSLIVFNRSVNELGTGERASLAETAGGIASGFVASSLGRSIGKALDVDLFEITTSDQDTGETAGGVTLGKQISDKAFVRFRQQFGQRSFTEFMLEYQLAKFLRVETRVSPETSGVANRLTQRRVERAGLDLIFFFSY